MNLLLFLGCVIIITDKMKKTMNHHPMKFLVKLRSVSEGVLPDAVNTDEQIA